MEAWFNGNGYRPRYHLLSAATGKTLCGESVEGPAAIDGYHIGDPEKWLAERKDRDSIKCCGVCESVKVRLTLRIKRHGSAA